MFLIERLLNQEAFFVRITYPSLQTIFARMLIFSDLTEGLEDTMPRMRITEDNVIIANT
jgi:hypothetical protein